jgi:rhodanese-related sulfurtransferase
MSFKRLLVLATALSAVSAHGAEPAATAAAAQPKSTAHELSRAEFERLLAKPEHLLILDVRRPDELTHIGGFPAYFSVQIKDLENNLAWIPKGRTIVTVSNHAKRSGQAAELLASKGFKVAGTVGAQTFEEQGGKLTKFEVPVRPAGSTATAAGGAALPAPAKPAGTN